MPVVRNNETRYVTPGEFVKVIKKNPNKVLPTYIENVCDSETGEVLAIKMERGSWEVTSTGFDAIEGLFGKE